MAVSCLGEGFDDGLPVRRLGPQPSLFSLFVPKEPPPGSGSLPPLEIVALQSGWLPFPVPHHEPLGYYRWVRVST